MMILNLARETEDLLGDDVPLHLRGAGVDRACPRVQRDLPPGIARRRVAARVVGPGRPARPLADGGARAPLLAVGAVGEEALADVAHPLTRGDRRAEALADHRVLDRAGP